MIIFDVMKDFIPRSRYQKINVAHCLKTLSNCDMKEIACIWHNTPGDTVYNSIRQILALRESVRITEEERKHLVDMVTD